MQKLHHKYGHEQQGFQKIQVEIVHIEQKVEPKNQTQYNFKISGAIPLLKIQPIDDHIPKSLIKSFKMKKEPTQLLDVSSQQNEYQFEQCSNIKTTKVKQGISELFEKYIYSNNYVCVYHKYAKEDVQKFNSNQLKKYFNQQYFSSYFLNLQLFNQFNYSIAESLDQSKFHEELKMQNCESIKFSSRFECGNLFSVFKDKKKENQFDLFIQNDVNTKGYNNWFYFSVRTKTKNSLQFKITNLLKSHSLFCKGMKPAVFSYKKYLQNKIGWERRGQNIEFYRSQVLRESISQNQQEYYYCLSFQIQFQFEDDITYIALNIPYSYTKMLKMISEIENIAKNHQNLYIRKQNVCNTISLNVCPYLTLTMKSGQQQKNKNKIIGIIARQHPSETVSSFVIEGLLKFLVSGASEALFLLKKYIFKIIPMMNPDGVIYGNSRCDISGADINRKWKNPDKLLYPTIVSTKRLFQKLTQEGGEIDYFFDLHGHSKKLNSFIYGCNLENQIETRMIPFLMHKIQPNFSFFSCTFGIHSQKINTARAEMTKLMKKSKSYTLQTSFFGNGFQEKARHWTVKQLQKIGENLLIAVYLQKTHNEKKSKKFAINFSTVNFQIENLIRIARNRFPEGEEEDSGSQSEPQINDLQIIEKEKLFLKKISQNSPIKLKKSGSKRSNKFKEIGFIQSEEKTDDRSIDKMKKLNNLPSINNKYNEQQKKPRASKSQKQIKQIIKRQKQSYLKSSNKNGSVQKNTNISNIANSLSTPKLNKAQENIMEIKLIINTRKKKKNSSINQETEEKSKQKFITQNQNKKSESQELIKSLKMESLKILPTKHTYDQSSSNKNQRLKDNKKTDSSSFSLPKKKTNSKKNHFDFGVDLNAIKQLNFNKIRGVIQTQHLQKLEKRKI